ncbi:hypothetical protein AAG570_003326 [Ranatra chinensis]|uniref:Dipeptidyl peptidase 9 n=1 Tax=Ranatra chinensis TaxID=642074 RepID=A0ABD0Y6Y9_9HEMI
MRRQLSALSTVVPSLVKFRTLPDGTVRIFFLGSLPNGWETTLHYADVSSKDSKNAGKLHWQQLLEFNLQKVGGARCSREEQLMLERKRLTTWGIASYELHPHSGKIVFPAAGTLYQCVDNTRQNGPLFPSEIRTNSNGAKLSPEICPSNSDLMAYVFNSDIWVAHEPSGSYERVTFAHKGGRGLVDDPLSAGIPSYVIQEEFLRYQGFWWQPHTNDNVYRLLYEEVDDSEVGLYTFTSFTPPSSNLPMEQYRFPRAGTPNSKSNVKLIELRVSDTEMEAVRTLELRQPLCQMFPWMEYLVRVGWTPDSNHIWLEMLDRRQKRLELVVISIDNFVEPLPNVYDHSDGASDDQPLPIAYLVASQASDVWINVHDLLYIFPMDQHPMTRMSFVWGSEETGFRHLYHITVQLDQPLHEPNVDNNYDGTQMRCRLEKKVALTYGDWEVLGSQLWVDNARSLVYFMGLKHSPLEKHLYVVSLHRPGHIRLLTCAGYSYNVDINQECNVCVAVYSNIQRVPACDVFRIVHSACDSGVDGVTLVPVGCLLESQEMGSLLHCRELFKHTISSGDTLYAMVFRPHNYTPGMRYPTVLNVYGGPEVQLVTNSFEGMKHVRMHMLASQGYCVVAIDSRGSQHRGLAFEAHIKHRMGTVELNDQIEMLRWLSSEIGCIDMTRVGILGWSYGGYLSLMALAQHPDFFKVAIAGAPVTCWKLYDTGYTERYMDLPDNNRHGYNAGSILTYVNQFPDEENRLLIIHGLIDDNVHFSHTSSLINQMVRKGKPYQLQVYPSERHSLRSLDASKHYETVVLSFLQNYL